MTQQPTDSSPEQPNPTPEYKRKGHFNKDLDGLMEHARPLSPDQKLAAMHNLLDGTAAELQMEPTSETVAGGGVEKIDGAAFNERLYILADLLKKESTDESFDPFTVIPKAEGLRDLLVTTLEDPDTRQAMLDAIAERERAEQQARAAIERAEAGEGTPVTTPDKLGALAADRIFQAPGATTEAPAASAETESISFDSLSPDDQAFVEQRRQLIGWKSEAERDKDFSEAGRIRREITELERDMSPAVKKYLGYAG